MKNKLFLANVPRPSFEMLMSSVQAQDGILVPSKPNNGSADFTFARTGKATRVNRNGLIETAFILGENQAIDGDFSEGEDFWIPQVGWTIANGKASQDGTGNASQGNLIQTEANIGLVVGKFYKVTVTVTDYTSGDLEVDPVALEQFGINGTGVFSLIFEAGNVNFFFRNGRNFIGSITNVIVEEVFYDDIPRIDYLDCTFVPVLGSDLVTNGGFDTDTDWTLSANTTISGGKLNYNDAQYPELVYQLNVVTVGTVYKLSYDVSDYVQGSVNIKLGTSGEVVTINANGSFEHELTALGNAHLYLAVSYVGGTSLKLDNISVKEITGYTTNDEPSLLLETASTNLIADSNNFSSWNRNGNVTIETDASITNPFGDLCQKLTRTGTGTSYVSEDAIPISASTNYCVSYFAKKGNYAETGIECGTGVDNVQLKYNFDTATFTTTISSGTQTLVSYGVEEYQDGWFRIYLVFTGTLTSVNCAIYVYNTTDDYVLADMFQFEASSYPSSFIPTSGATVTRQSENLVNGGNVNLINSQRGVIFFEMKSEIDGTYNNISISDGTVSNRISWYSVTPTGSSVRGSFINLGESTINSIFNIPTYDSEYHKYAIRWSGTEFVMFVDGVKGATQTIVPYAVGLLNRITFDYGNGLGGQPFKGRVKYLKLFNKALGDSQLINLTT